MRREVLSLFKAVMIEPPYSFYPLDDTLIEQGIVTDPRIPINAEFLYDVSQVFTRDKTKLNTAFNTSWKDVLTGDHLELMKRQIGYYIASSIKEHLLPDFCVSPPPPDFPPEKWSSLLYIRAITLDELKAEILSLCGKYALDEATLRDLTEVIIYLQMGRSIAESSKNRELVSMLRTRLDLPPDDGEGYLRYMINKLTGRSLLIKDRITIHLLSRSPGLAIDNLMSKAPCDMSDIFLRYKPLFLAMKKAAGNKLIFNQLRRRASRTPKKKYVEPFSRTITSRLKKGGLLLNEWTSFLETAGMSELYRVSGALSMRASTADETNVEMFRIRNGRVWMCEGPSDVVNISRPASALLPDLHEAITDRLAKIVRGRTISVTRDVCLGLPFSDKQFIGDVPVGTSVDISGSNCAFSIHWFNTIYDERVDLDLSVIDLYGRRVGWGGSQRRDGIAFSGDLVDAPLPYGAAETLFIEEGAIEEDDVKLLYVNFFNYDMVGEPVEYSINVASNLPMDTLMNRRYTLPPDRILFSTRGIARYEQGLVAAIIPDKGSYRLVFTDMNLGRSAVSGREPLNNLRYMRKYARSLVHSNLNMLLVAAGAELIHEPGGDIDLRVGYCNKTDILRVAGIVS